MPDRGPCFLGVVADQHVGHQVLRRYAGAFQRIHALEENALITKVVPSGVELALIETRVPILDAGERRLRFFGRDLRLEISA